VLVFDEVWREGDNDRVDFSELGRNTETQLERRS
jgi:hypothetical protein